MSDWEVIEEPAAARPIQNSSWEVVEQPATSTQSSDWQVESAPDNQQTRPAIDPIPRPNDPGFKTQTGITPQEDGSIHVNLGLSRTEPPPQPTHQQRLAPEAAKLNALSPELAARQNKISPEELDSIKSQMSEASSVTKRYNLAISITSDPQRRQRLQDELRDALTAMDVTAIWEPTLAQALLSPSVDWLPKVTAEDAATLFPGSKGAQIAAGIQRGVTDIAQGITAPIGILLPGAMAAKYFGAQAVASQGELARAAGEASVNGDPGQKAEAWTALLANSAFAVDMLAPKSTPGDTRIIPNPTAPRISPDLVDRIVANTASARAPATAEAFKQIVRDTTSIEEPSVAEPGLIGMGAAIPEEFSQSQGSPTAMKYRRIDQERAARGLQPLTSPESTPDQVTLNRAMEAIDQDAQLPERLVSELLEKPRAIEDWENHVLLLRKIELRNELDKSARAITRAYEDHQPEMMQAEQLKRSQLSDQLQDLEQASRVSGSARGRALRALRVMVNEDFSLAAIEQEMRAAHGGRQLTEAELVEAADLSQRLQETQKRVEELEAESSGKIARVEVDRLLAEARASLPKAPEYSPGILAKAEAMVRAFEESDLVKAARERLKGKLLSPTPENLADLAVIGATHIARGALEFAKFTDRMIAEFGENIRPHLADIFARAQVLHDDFIKRTAKLDAPQITKFLKARADADSRITDATEKIEARFEKGEQAEIHPLVNKIVRAMVERDPKITRETLVDQVHDILKEFDPEISRLETMDAISGRGTFSIPSQDLVSKTVRDLKTQIRLVGHQQDIIAGKPLPRTGPQRDKMTDAARRELQKLEELKRKYGVRVTDPAAQLASTLQARKTWYQHRLADLKQEIKTRERIVKSKSPSPTDPELERLRAEYAKTREEHAQIFKKPGLTDAQRLKLALAGAERAEKAWQQRLENAKIGNFDPLTAKKTPVSAPELEAIRARTESLKEQVQELRDIAEPKKTPEQIALQSLKTRLATETAKLLEKTAAGDFSKRPKRDLPSDPELEKARASHKTARAAFQEAKQKAEWETASVFQKSKRLAGDTYDLARTLMTTGEFSFVLRQGKLSVLSRPIATLRAVREAFRAMRNEETARVIEESIFSHPDYPQAVKDKLFIADTGEKLSRHEESIMGHWVGKVPVLSAFTRAARVFLNKLRFDVYLAMRKSLLRADPTGEASKQIATFINESTGRGTLGKSGEPAAVFLGRILFSPRYLASRIQLLAGHSMWAGTGATRRVIATEYARALIGGALYYTLLRWYFSDPSDPKKGEVNTDPRSSDFGKIRIGDTRLDPLAGLAQPSVLAARTITGQKMTGSGKIQPIRGKVPFGGAKWTDVAGRFARSKLHPVPGAIASLFDGTDFSDEPVTLGGEAGKMAGPITYIDIYQALKEQDLDDATALSILAFFGEGLQTIKKRQKKK